MCILLFLYVHVLETFFQQKKNYLLISHNNTLGLKCEIFKDFNKCPLLKGLIASIKKFCFDFCYFDFNVTNFLHVEQNATHLELPRRPVYRDLY